jgi:thiosulfate/3-mercaptopyruvate sulfurtransferase
MTKMYLVLGIMILSLIALASSASAAGSCCSVGNWEATAQAFLGDADAGGQITNHNHAQSDEKNASKAAEKPAQRSDAFSNGASLISMKSVSSSHLVLDISNSDSSILLHIKNAIHLPSQSLLDANGALKSQEELAMLLGKAGISQKDTVVLYGSPESSGEAELVFWSLSYLGQADVKILDGTLKDWEAAGLPVGSYESRPAVEYMPSVKSDLLADYEYVKSGQAQILDVRPFVEYGKGRIPGSVALDPSNLIKGDRIKDADGLKAAFERLDTKKPIVVYSDDYRRSALVWFALQLMGYEAGIYTWEDWKAHEAAQVQAKAANVAEDAASSKYTKLGTT